MEGDSFIEKIGLVNAGLVDLGVSRAYNSIGSNVFFEFGNEKEIALNGRRIPQKEWSIWLCNASWRISKNGRYVVGSGDSPKAIETSIQQLVGKSFKSVQFVSSFLDAEFEFIDGYQIITFFNLIEENQWTIFLPNNKTVEVDCSNMKEIENSKKIASYFSINRKYVNLPLPIEGLSIVHISYDENQQPTFNFERDFKIIFYSCTWRLERNGEYVIGYLDDEDDIASLMPCLVGQKVKQIGITEFHFEAQFEFDNQYVLKTFMCCRESSQWAAFSKSNSIFHANVTV